MEFTYENVLEFITQYFKDFNDYAQDPATTHRMHAHMAPDFEFTPLVAGNAKVSGRDEFLRLMSAHPSSHESLMPQDIMIDLKKKTVVVLLGAELSEKATGKVLVKKSYHVLYRLTLDEQNDIKIKSVLFFEEILPPGTLDIGDVLKRDPAIARLYTDEEAN